MRIGAFVLGCAVAMAAPAEAQNFVNLDFEGIRFTPPDPQVPLLLTWDEALPGWNHSAGDSTDVVNYLFGHLGFSQNYVLLDRTVAPAGAISGSFAVGMRGGTLHESEPHGDFVQAFIEQRGLVPAGATTLRMLANERMFSVFLDGVPIDMRPVGLDPASPTYAQDLLFYVGEWSGDISAFAGRVADLKILDRDPQSGQPELLVVDDIRLLAVPEPSAAALMLMGLLACVLSGRRYHGPRAGRKAKRPAAERRPSCASAHH